MCTNKNSLNNLNTLFEKKIAVVGIGGVGGYLGAMFAHTYPHVTLAARGKRLEHIREHGLILHSAYSGEISAVPEKAVTADTLEPQDYIFVCVKNYSLEEVCRQIKPFVGDHTILIPVMNGVDTGERMRKMLNKGTVIDSLIYIVAYASPDFSITQIGNLASLRIGIKNASPEHSEKVREVSVLLSGAHIHHKIADNIEAAIWRKYILNCAYNITTARYNQTIGELRNDPQKTAQYETLVRESWLVSEAAGAGVAESSVSEIIRQFYNELDPLSTSSLQRDLWAGHPSELETFSGYLVRKAKELSVPVPLSESMYSDLKRIATEQYSHQKGKL